MRMFCDDLKEQAIKIMSYEQKKMAPLTDVEKESHKNQTICYICEKEFCIDKDNEEFKLMQKVRDHCHYTGKYRGAAYSICNLRCKIKKEIPVVFHNGSTYDYHLIIEQIAKEFKGYFDCLGENTEQRITFSVPIKKVIDEDNDKDNDNDSDKDSDKDKTVTYRLKFIDSCRFMKHSLSNLVDNLSEINNINHEISRDALIKKFYNTYQLCNNDFDKFNLLLRKGVYPHEYMGKCEKFSIDKLPNKELFYSELNKEHITNEDYEHAQKIWDTFKISNFGEYHDLYVQSDTSLLADVFENFRDKCIKIHKVDLANFLTAPGLAWFACLKNTDIKLELLTDIDMLNMFEKGIRGGMCQASYRYAKVNNKYMNNYDKNIESSYLEYVDANNLYGYAICKKLSVDCFKWINDLSIFTEDFIKNYDDDESDIGYLFVVDVEYPKKLHMLHSDLPFLPEKMTINKSGKFVGKLKGKEEYYIHILALKQALNHGLKLKKVHSAIEFRHEYWLKPYIDVNTGLRNDAKKDFEKDFFKLMNNSVFGKIIENVRKHRDIKLVTTDKRRSTLASEPNYHSTKYISKELSIIEMRKSKVKMNKPIYLGQAILDISKTLMYEFWYDHILCMVIKHD